METLSDLIGWEYNWNIESRFLQIWWRRKTIKLVNLEIWSVTFWFHSQSSNVTIHWITFEPLPRFRIEKRNLGKPFSHTHVLEFFSISWESRCVYISCESNSMYIFFNFWTCMVKKDSRIPNLQHGFQHNVVILKHRWTTWGS